MVAISCPDGEPLPVHRCFLCGCHFQLGADSSQEASACSYFDEEEDDVNDFALPRILGLTSLDLEVEANLIVSDNAAADGTQTNESVNGALPDKLESQQMSCAVGPGNREDETHLLCLDCLYATTDQIEDLVLMLADWEQSATVEDTINDALGAEWAEGEAAVVKEWQQQMGLSMAETAQRENHLSEVRLKQAMADRLKRARSEFNRVHKISVLNQCFFISAQEGQEAVTINGLHLGRSVLGQIKSAELNLALGDTVLLAEVLARKLLALGRENIIADVSQWSPRLLAISKNLACRGSQSHVSSGAAIPTDSVKPLYLVDSAIQWFFHLPKFNEGMSEFCAMLQLLIEVAQKSSTLPVVPMFAVQDGKIGGKSLRYKIGDEESWTGALGFCLINLKWLIGTCSKLS